MLIDTHCHLDAAEFDADRDAVVSRSLQSGVSLLVVPAVEVANFQAVAGLASRHPCVRYALGIHPLYVDRAESSALAVLREAVSAAMADERFVAIGEIGLDHFVPDTNRARQDHFFAEQLRIARDFDLPVILHVRRALDAVLKQLRRFAPSGGIAHAFNGSAQQASQFIDRGFVLGFGGAMTFERALQIRRLAASLPPEALVLETDAPDISPAWLHPGRNAPTELPAIAQVLAGLRQAPLEVVMADTSANAQRVLPRLGHLT